MIFASQLRGKTTEISHLPWQDTLQTIQRSRRTLHGMPFQIIKGEHISEAPSFLYVLPDDRDDSNLHCSTVQGPGSRRKAHMNGSGRWTCPRCLLYACRRENGSPSLSLLSNVPYTGGIVSAVNGYESMIRSVVPCLRGSLVTRGSKVRWDGEEICISVCQKRKITRTKEKPGRNV